MGRRAGDGGRARGELTLERDATRAALHGHLYDAGSQDVEVLTDAGIEGRSFLLAEERSTGRLSARYRAANFPRKRADAALVPEFRGVLETDDGGTILFEWQGLAVLPDSGMRRLLGSSCTRPTTPATVG